MLDGIAIDSLSYEFSREVGHWHRSNCNQTRQAFTHHAHILLDLPAHRVYDVPRGYR